jgi:hypothetical protein
MFPNDVRRGVSQASESSPGKRTPQELSGNLSGVTIGSVQRNTPLTHKMSVVQ